MLALMGRLTDMPGWHRQIFDTDFALKWKNEALMMGLDVTKSMAEWVSMPKRK